MTTTVANIKAAAKGLPMKRGAREALIYVGGLRVEGTKMKHRETFSNVLSSKETAKGMTINLSIKKILKSVDTLNDAKIMFRDTIVSEFQLNKDKLVRTRIIKDKVQEIKSLETAYKRELMEVLNGYSFLVKNSIVITGDNLTSYNKWIDLVKLSKKVISTIIYAEKNSIKVKATRNGIKKAVKAGLIETYDYMEKVKQDFTAVADHKKAAKLEQLKNVFLSEEKINPTEKAA